MPLEKEVGENVGDVLDTADLSTLAYKLRENGNVQDGLLVLKAREEILNHRRAREALTALEEEK